MSSPSSWRSLSGIQSLAGLSQFSPILSFTRNFTAHNLKNRVAVFQEFWIFQAAPVGAAFADEPDSHTAIDFDGGSRASRFKDCEMLAWLFTPEYREIVA